MGTKTDLLQGKRKFLVASADPSRRSAYRDLISEHVAKSVVIFSEDGLNVMQKIENDPPNVLLIDESLPKLSGTEVVKLILEENRHIISVIILSAIPEHEDFVDQVAVGQVQYLDPKDAKAEMSACLMRALNWLVHGDQLEFRLKFMAAGDVLIRQGENADFVYILNRGRMHAVAKGKGGEVILGQIEPQEFVGEMAYVTGEARSADVVAVTDCELIEIPIGHLSHLLFQRPSWAKALMRTLTKRLKVANTVTAAKA